MIEISANQAENNGINAQLKILLQNIHIISIGETATPKSTPWPFLRLAAINTQTNRISGILPPVLFDPPGKEKRFISLPYTDAAGIVSGRRRLSFSASVS